jgi:hypothetical protein
MSNLPYDNLQVLLLLFLKKQVFREKKLPIFEGYDFAKGKAYPGGHQ